MMRIFVFDTNVLLSAALSARSASSTALRNALREGIVVYSTSTLAELEDKIRLPKFDKYQPLSRRLDFFHDYETWGFPTHVTCKITACRDPKDDKFLELAKSASADCIVTKDKDLLVLHPFEGIPIINVTHFLNWL